MLDGAQRSKALAVVTFPILARHRHGSERIERAAQRAILDADGEGWSFRIRGRREIVRVTGRFRTDDAGATIEAVALGMGLGMMPAWQVRDLVANGALEVVLEDFEDAKRPIFAVSPATRIPLTKTRLFIDTLAQRLRRETL
jgi:DNA-binding transcriptional LysR family regulator